MEKGERGRQRVGRPQFADRAAREQRSRIDHGAGDSVSQYTRGAATAAARSQFANFRQYPPVIASDGKSVKEKLPKPTGPLSPVFFDSVRVAPAPRRLPYSGNYPLVNAATNSGLVRGGQFNAGGFGDEGLQWQKVHVGGNVQVVHNSLSVHPEGTMLAGISVSNVSYGSAVSPGVARHLSVLPTR